MHYLQQLVILLPQVDPRRDHWWSHLSRYCDSNNRDYYLLRLQEDCSPTNFNGTSSTAGDDSISTPYDAHPSANDDGPAPYDDGTAYDDGSSTYDDAAAATAKSYYHQRLKPLYC